MILVAILMVMVQMNMGPAPAPPPVEYEEISCAVPIPEDMIEHANHGMRIDVACPHCAQ